MTAAGKLTDERFATMSRRYEDEQCELQGKIKALSKELQQSKSRVVSTDTFIAAVRKYTRVRKLTPRMLNELIEKIEVYHAERIDGVVSQNLTIHYNCIGSIEIPSELGGTIPEVTVEARKGVAYSYTPEQVAI